MTTCTLQHALSFVKALDDPCNLVDVGSMVRAGRRQERGSVSLVEPTGAETLVLVDLGHTEITVRMPGLPSVAPGEAVSIEAPPAALHLFDAASGKRLN